MRVRFYGTRGSIATPGAATIRYGGNTSCVAVRSRSGTLVVLDMGTGAAVLGRELTAAGGKLRGHILISHTHWDHIQGLPFFAPLFVPGNEWDIYAPRGLRTTLRETLAGQMEHTYFPVELDQLGAAIRYHDLVEGTLQVGDIAVTARYLNHPALTLGYRLEADRASVVYSCDHEPHSRQLASAAGEIEGQDRWHAEFLGDADLVIHDAQYVAAEYPTKIGWGHSTVEYALAVARHAGVKRLALSHHDPTRSDDAVDEVVDRLRTGMESGAVEVFAAAEGMEIELAGTGVPARAIGPSAQQSVAPALVEVTVAIAARNPSVIERLKKALADEDVRRVFAPCQDIAAVIARERPSLLVLEAGDGRDRTAAMAAARELDSEVPIIEVVAQSQAAELEDPRCSDQLVEPFSSSYARARIRAALMRRACRWRRAGSAKDEAQRLETLGRLHLLDTPPEERFDRITRLATALFQMPIALLTLIDRDRQWFKSSCGFDIRESPRDESFCAHAVVSRELLVVPDALRDDRFADHPAVLGSPRVRFYAGYPLILSDGVCVGTLCVVDTRPREFGDGDRAHLCDLAKLAASELERT